MEDTYIIGNETHTTECQYRKRYLVWMTDREEESTTRIVIPQHPKHELSPSTPHRIILDHKRNPNEPNKLH